MPSGTCTPAAPLHPQCKVCLGGCSVVYPGGLVLAPPVGSASELPLESCCGHEMEPAHVNGRKGGNSGSIHAYIH